MPTTANQHRYRHRWTDIDSNTVTGAQTDTNTHTYRRNGIDSGTHHVYPYSTDANNDVSTGKLEAEAYIPQLLYCELLQVDQLLR